MKWSYGEVLKPETINYRTQRFERDGLFAENIFGPSKDFECYCGKYKRIRYKGIICDKCGVEVTRSSVRRERMAHIKLAVPVSHIWFQKSAPSKMALVLGIQVSHLERVIYFASYVVTEVNEKVRESLLKKVAQEFKQKSKNPKNKKKLDNLRKARNRTLDEIKSLNKLKVISELEYRELSMRYGQLFRAGIGAEAIREILESLDLKEEVKRTKADLKKQRVTERAKLLRRLYILQSMIDNDMRPEWMCFTVLPVISPDLRPLVQLDGGRFATSDLNDLYRRIINRNNRLKRLLDLGAPEVICRNEKRMLQEAVDALIDNSSRSSQSEVMASTGQRRALKSLADMLKGKQGRFRKNLLGKRVDYSGRSVIVAGPDLSLDEVGIPKKMALEIFRPFVIRKLIEADLAHNVRSAGKVIEQEIDEVWDFLEEVTKNRYVLLNRAPTLHRLSIQAFRPILIEGQSIQLHPLVCTAFNADFDGDQMAVHLPLTRKAQEEAKEIIAADKNLLKPATGKPIANPEKDMVFGVYYMTKINHRKKGSGKIFADSRDAILTHQFDEIHLQAKITVYGISKEGPIETSVGRILFNEILPPEMEFVNKGLDKTAISELVAEVFTYTDPAGRVSFLDRIKSIGFHYATLSGFSWSMDDLVHLKGKEGLVKKARQKVLEIQDHYENGLLTDKERYDRVIEIWFEVKSKVSEEAKAALDEFGVVRAMVDSKARGSWELVTQMMGMKGLVVNPAGQIIELPIVSSFKEGFKVLEYFISTHGTRKGMADTALRTATAGYLTRRLVDVAQDVVITEEDCKTKNGLTIFKEDRPDSWNLRLMGRVIAGGKPVLIDKENIKKFLGKDEVRLRSPSTCVTHYGICKQCYGYDLGRNKMVELGEAVGVITAQAIGEPGTQLTLRTFHGGGAAGASDITQGLPRVEELFECRDPKGEAIISDIEGEVVSVKDVESGKIVNIKHKGKQKVAEFLIPIGYGIWAEVGDKVVPGDQLSEGSISLKKLFAMQGASGLVRYITNEIQIIYSNEGVDISDKYIEIIIRQMLSRVEVKDSGNTKLLPGDTISKDEFLAANKKLSKSKKKATATSLLLGITRVSSSTESWLSAASFQETTRSLVEAAIRGKEDKLRWLKENVIVGKLIPAGTSFRKR